MQAVKTALTALVFYAVINALLLGLAIGVGSLLHWIIPAVDLGMAILIGLVSTALTIYFYTRVTAAIAESLPPEEEDDYPDPEMIARIINPPRKWQRVPPALIISEPLPPSPAPRRRRKSQPPPDR